MVIILKNHILSKIENVCTGTVDIFQVFFTRINKMQYQEGESKTQEKQINKHALRAQIPSRERIRALIAGILGAVLYSAGGPTED